MAFSKLIDDIEHGEGVFDPSKRYIINNSTQEDIEVSWAAKEVQAPGHGRYLIKAGEMGGPYNQFLAYHILKHLVNREMQREGKATFIGSPMAREPYEKRFLQEVKEGEQVEDPIRARIREEERTKLMASMVGINTEQAISDGGITTSETRRKNIEKKEKEEAAKEEAK